MEKYSFFNDVSNDRIYFADDFARHLARYFTNGIFNNGCQVLADTNDMSINVSIGSANINGYRYDNDSKKVLRIENADGVLSRIDNIVIRWDLTNRTITAQVVKGAFSDTPIAPELVRDSTIYDLRIATISIPAGTTTITQDLVTDTRFITSDCGNVIAAVETPDTENLFIQIQAAFDKELKILQKTSNDNQKTFNSKMTSYDKTFNTKITGYDNSYNREIETLTNDFDTWFNSIKGQIDSDMGTKLQNEINEINNSNFQTQEQVETIVNNKVSAVLKYKGNVANYTDLPTNAEIGDTYNIANASSHNKAGDNAAWNGSEWDVLSGIIDLSGYATKDQIPTVPTKLSQFTNDILIKSNSESTALSSSSSNTSKFYYWVEE